MKYLSLACFVLTFPIFVLGQSSSITPQPSTFQRVLPQATSQYGNTATRQNVSFIKQQIQPHQPAIPDFTSDRLQVERKQKETDQLLQEVNRDFAQLEQQRFINAMLDTTFGKPPVMSKQQYQATKLFWDALVVLTDMQLGKRPFSISEAVYTVENAYFKGELLKETFIQSIQARADLCRQIIRKEGLEPDDDIAKNFAIQQLYQQDNKYRDPRNGMTITVPRLEYDFTDFMGDSSHAQMFVSKLMTTGKGQCHSMPVLYLCIAEQLGASAHLSLSPEHSFIRFADKDGNMYNFESTNGYIVSDNWMLQSGYISAAAIKNKVYLDTLSQKQLLALCMVDLAMGYQYDYGYDGFTETVLKYALQLAPDGMQQHIMLSNFWATKMNRAIQYYGITSQEMLDRNIIAKTLQKRMLQEYDVIDGLGFQQMPKEAYQSWLQSVNEQKEKQDQKALQQKIDHLIQDSKIKAPIINKKQ